MKKFALPIAGLVIGSAILYLNRKEAKPTAEQLKSRDEIGWKGIGGIILLASGAGFIYTIVKK